MADKKITDLTDGGAIQDADEFIVARSGSNNKIAGSQIASKAPVQSVFGRTGAVVAANADYSGIVASALTGATAATRYVGATTSGAPVSGSFLKGDFIITQDGHIYICTVAGSPGTWTQASGGSTSPLTTKGDVWGFSTVDARIPVGSNGQALIADSSQALGVKWGVPTAAEGNGDESLFTIAASGASQTLDIANGATQKITLTGNCTFTFTSPASGSAWYMTLLLVQDATGSRTVTWPTITWLGSGIAPTLQTAASSVDSVVVFTVDGGSTWLGVAQTSASGLKSGTSFPGSPSDGDLFYRTDRRILYEYVSAVTRWLSLDRKYVSLSDGKLTDAAAVCSSGNVGTVGWAPIFEDIYVESWTTVVPISGGTNNASNFFTFTLIKQTSAQAQTTVTSFNTASDGSGGTTAVHTVSIGSLFLSASFTNFLMASSKTGTPSGYRCPSYLVCRSAG